MKRYYSSLIFVALSFFAFSSLNAQILKPARWTFTTVKEPVKVGETVELVFTAAIDSDWYMYSSELKVKGPSPTTVEFVSDDSFKPTGRLIPVNPKEKYDDVWDGKIHYFVKEAKFIQKVKILKANPKIEGKIISNTCTDKDGRCVPSKDKFSFEIKTIGSTP